MVERACGPKVSIIVLNWNGPKTTAECLDSLTRVGYPNFEVILVDNGSSDGSQDYFRERYPWATLVENRANLGFSGGNNAGIRAALKGRPDYVLLLNNDTVVDTFFLDELVKAGESDKGAGILGPKIYYHGSPHTIWYAGGAISLFRGASRHFGFREPDRGQHDRPLEVSFVTGCALFIRREAIERIGLLDETFFCYSEDADWCIRAKRAGYKCRYVPSARIWHKEGVSGRKVLSLMTRLGTRNIAYLIYKHASGWRRALCYASFLMTWLGPRAVKGVLTGRVSEAAYMLKGLHDFWTMDKAYRAGKGPATTGCGVEYGKKAR